MNEYIPPDSEENSSQQKYKQTNKERRVLHSPELYWKPSSYQWLQVWPENLRPDHKFPPSSDVLVRRWTCQVCNSTCQICDFLLLRFASEKFSLDEKDLENNFIHLTNFTSDNAGEGEIPEDYPDGVQVISYNHEAC